MPDTLEAPRPTQDEVIQDAGQPDQDLLAKTGEHLKEGGYNISPESLDPTHQSVLDKIGENMGDKAGIVVNTVGSTIQESIGQGNERIKLAEGLGWRQRFAQRIKGKLPFLERK